MPSLFQEILSHPAGKKVAFPAGILFPAGRADGSSSLDASQARSNTRRAKVSYLHSAINRRFVQDQFFVGPARIGVSPERAAIPSGRVTLVVCQAVVFFAVQELVAGRPVIVQSFPMAETKNYFIHATAAERYARGRPDLYPPIVRRICEVTGCSRFASALDVGCGTGLSTRAIARVADRVFGIDSSPEMLGQATGGPGIAYQQARAESLPFADRSFDLINVGLAFHWFVPDAFLREARRVLRDDGWLVIYNSGFLGQLHGEDDFARWHGSLYLARYPMPPRSQSDVTEEFVRPFGFALVQKETHDQDISMSSDQFVSYLLTQSNVIAVVEQGTECLEDAARFIIQGVAPFFDGQGRTLKWQSHIDFLRVWG